MITDYETCDTKSQATLRQFVMIKVLNLLLTIFLQGTKELLFYVVEFLQ